MLGITTVGFIFIFDGEKQITILVGKQIYIYRMRLKMNILLQLIKHF